MKTLEQLISIIEYSQNPDKNSPSDPEQDLNAIVPYTIEEAYALADAIQQNDEIKIRSRLGALFLQVIYLMQLAEKEGLFSFKEVIEEIYQKLTDKNSGTEGELTATMEKSGLLGRQGISDSNLQKTGLLDAIPVDLPALSRAQRLQERAATVGFDWKDIEPVWDKLDEELDEIKSALSHKASYPEILEEAGDLIFVCVNLCRHLSIDAESALSRANYKFSSRFNFIEDRLIQDGKSLEEVTLDVMDNLWEEAKSNLTND